MANIFDNIVVVNNFIALNWYPNESHNFYNTSNKEENLILQDWLLSLNNGVCLPIRGRDWIGFNGETNEWDYGVATKYNDRLFFIYESGDIESLLISIINFKDLIHFTLKSNNNDNSIIINNNINPDKVIIISHGFSEEVGPNYPLIRTLEHIAKGLGWKVIVPDFRITYKFSSQRGRAERVRIIYEELLCLEPKPSTVLLIGHSQGGACSLIAATDRIIKHCNIKGILLYGSENPCSLDAMNWKPNIPKGKGIIVHADGDFVISSSEMEQIAKHINFKFINIKSSVEKGKRDCWGDDINHDFLAKDLMEKAVDILKDFLKQY